MSLAQPEVADNPLLATVTPLRAEVIPADEIPQTQFDKDIAHLVERSELTVYDQQEQNHVRSQETSVSLSTLANGSIETQFQTQFQEILDNVVDPNTEATAVREINIKIKMKPGKTRQNMDLTATVTGKKAPWKSANASVMIDSDNGRGVAAERIARANEE